jgi:hydrogenase maturation protease
VSAKKILIYGYGNPGRQDDGLGNAFIQRLEKWAEQEQLEGFEFDSNYQLNIEDAANIAGKDLVVFVDASEEQIDDFILTPVNSTTEVSFTTHAASPGYIVNLCRELYNEIPATYLLHIKGYEWEFKEGLSAGANNNLEKSLEDLKDKLKNPEHLIHSCINFEN